MALHLLKLCVGVDHPDELAAFQKRRIATTGRNAHITRQMPRRAREILDGGSLYWIIGGKILVRQRILALESFTDSQGIRRCRIELDPELVPVRPTPHRPFQGWRYLVEKAAPPDLPQVKGMDALPESMRRELMELCLI